MTTRKYQGTVYQLTCAPTGRPSSSSSNNIIIWEHYYWGCSVFFLYPTFSKTFLIYKCEKITDIYNNRYPVCKASTVLTHNPLLHGIQWQIFTRHLKMDRKSKIYFLSYTSYKSSFYDQKSPIYFCQSLKNFTKICLHKTNLELFEY